MNTLIARLQDDPFFDGSGAVDFLKNRSTVLLGTSVELVDAFLKDLYVKSSGRDYSLAI
jgi:hypothetical protein